MKEKFKDQPAFIMDFIKPSKEYGIHSIDIVTITLPNGDIQIVSCIMWCDCDEDTSHTCSNGYAIDVWDGKVVGGIGQYSAHFNKITNENGKLHGKIIKKIDEACKVIVASHKMLNEKIKWCPAVGWDFMIDDKEEILYFEGNQASYRIPRIIFLNFNNMIDFFRDIFWPFDEKYSVRPL